METIYLDNNATTRMADEVLAAMMPYLTDIYGNPSSIHRLGQRARQAIEESRESVATSIAARPREVTFTGGGSEAINTAIRGLLSTRKPRKKLIISTVEHSATRELAIQLAIEGVQVIEVPVDVHGTLDLEFFRSKIDDQTSLVSLMWANNETGVLMPVEEVGNLCRALEALFHCDATQVIGKIPVNVDQMPIDAMSFASHKFHGPKGVGGLYIRRGTRIAPLVIGGPQELGHRGGTENVPGIVGMAKAAELAVGGLADIPRIAALRDRLEKEILANIELTRINGRTDQRLANTTNIAFARLEAEAILLLLSEQGICASAGSACSSGSLEPSKILLAMGVDPIYAHGSIRFSFSHFNSEADVDQTLAILPNAISKLRAVLPVGA